METRVVVHRVCRALGLLLVSLGGLCWSHPIPSDAQITLDGSLGSSRTLTGPDVIIPADMGQQVAGNLFHSFGLFNVGAGESATFTGPNTVKMVIGRITGGELSIIDSSTFDLGEGGTVTVRASDTVFLAGTDPGGTIQSGITAEARSVGNAGSVLVEARTVTHTGGATISSGTFAQGRGGTVTVRASDAINLAGTNQKGSLPSAIDASSFNSEDAEAGDTGSVLVEARMVMLTDGALISTLTAGAGRSGAVTVLASDAVILSGTTSDGARSAIAVSSLATEEGAGDAGVIQIEARRVTLSGGAMIESESRGPGQGGTVTITATDTIDINGQDSGLYTTAEGSGTGGDIVTIARELRLTDDAVISSQSSGLGDSGTVAITARESFVSENSQVTTEATEADGGGIQLTAGRLVRLQDSQITAAAGRGEGTGGNVRVDVKLMVLQDGRMSADAFGGPGGNVTINAKGFLENPASRVTASSALNVSGEVNLQALVIDFSGLVGRLPQAPRRVAALQQQRCAHRRYDNRVSRFVVVDRDQLPVHPGEALPSPLVSTRPGGIAKLDSRQPATDLQGGGAGLVRWPSSQIAHLSPGLRVSQHAINGHEPESVDSRLPWTTLSGSATSFSRAARRRVHKDASCEDVTIKLEKVDKASYQ